MARLSEFEVIERYFAPLAGEGSFNLKDDAAEIIPSSGNSLVITQDAIAEGVHFFSDDSPFLIAKKALRVNLSDLTAKGAMPRSFSLALGLGNDWTVDWLEAFTKGLDEDCNQFEITLNGGDTFKTGAGFVVSITALGEVPSGQYKSRLEAQPGDAVFVTGTIGDGALGLLARQGRLDGASESHLEYLTKRYWLPEPRIEVIPIIRKYASAAMDISDGLVGDLEKLCSASRVASEVRLETVPFSDAVAASIKHDSKYLQTALTGGDDYEILLTVPHSVVHDLKSEFANLKLPVTDIGIIKEGEGVTVFDENRVAMTFDRTGYNHSG